MSEPTIEELQEMKKELGAWGAVRWMRVVGLTIFSFYVAYNTAEQFHNHRGHFNVKDEPLFCGFLIFLFVFVVEASGNRGCLFVYTILTLLGAVLALR